MTTMAGAWLAIALAAAEPSGEAAGPAEASPAAPRPKSAEGPAKARSPRAAAPAAEPAAVPEWLDPDGRTAGERASSPAGVRAWAELLVRERSYAAASRTYESLVRSWPLAPGIEGDLLSAARAALLARELDRAEALVEEIRSRWPKAAVAQESDEVRLLVAEARLSPAPGAAAGDAEAAAQARRALKTFSVILDADRAGPLAARAALGRARALLALERRTRAIEALEDLLKEYPRSDLVPEARRLLAEARERRSRGWSSERGELAGARESVEWAVEGSEAAARARGEVRPAAEAPDSIRDTYRAIAARQAELKIEEARLYLRLEQKRAAETVLRSVLGRYGDTPSAGAAARLLEELARE